ncbi:MAG: alanine dehydrogenase [Nitrosomonas sp.]|nr:MAG: alanine dehydrogenase [Nitrosomonas sp.]
MRIGVPKEIKVHEYRVAATPDLVQTLVAAGHEVWIQTQAGERIGYTDEMYRNAGAQIVDTAAQVYACELVFKVKEPQLSEVALLRKGQVIFCYLHLAAEPELTRKMLESQCVGIAYETVVNIAGALPLLTPASEIAGRVAIQVGATALQMNYGGSGVLLGGVPGTPRGRVVVLGGGVSGTEAARMAIGLGAQVTVVDRDISRLRQLDILFQGKLTTRYANQGAIEEVVKGADLVVGAVLIAGKKAPKLVSRAMVAKMRPGSVIVDIAIDQGGCCETSKPTTHDAPTYVCEGVIHYCVTNMPGTCPRTATQAITNATGRYVIDIASKGYQKAMLDDPGLRQGLNVHFGKVTNRYVAEDLGYEFVLPEEILSGGTTSISGGH